MKVKKTWVFILLLVFLISILARVAIAQTFVSVAPDPAGGGSGIGGFSRNHWISSINKMLSPFGNGPVTGDNSIRAYDPLANTWEYLWPAGITNGGVHNRDNQASFYIPRLDEFWIWGGSHMEEYGNLTGDPTAKALSSGRFKVSERKWIKTSTTNDGAFVDVVTGGIPYPGADPSMAWSGELDMGIMFGGSAEGNPVDTMWIFESNPTGPQLYKTSEFTGPRPPARDQAMNLMVAAGTDFYLFGGSAGSINNVQQYVKDFWKFDGIKRIWTRLADPPAVGYQSALTYDSDKRRIVAWVRDHLYAFSIDSNQWSDVTPPGLPCVFNQMAIYAPNAKRHIYEGGNRCDNQTNTYMMAAVSLSELSDGLNIPSRTWLARSYSTVPTKAPGNFGGTAGGKHMNLRAHPTTGEFWFVGGDSFETPYGDNQGIWSYQPRTNTWTEQYPNCGFLGDVMPGGPNESGWVYDTLRNKFWILPGFWFLYQSGPAGCGAAVTWNTATPITITGLNYFAVNESTGQRWHSWTGDFSINQIGNGISTQQTLTKIKPMDPAVTLYYQPPNGAYQNIFNVMSFDPATKKWALGGFPCEPTSDNCSTEHPKNGFYDPVTDSIYRVGTDFRGVVWFVLRLATKTWDIYSTYIPNGGDLAFEWIAGDPVSRLIYVMDPINYRLRAFHMDSHELLDLGTPPPTPLGPFSPTATNGKNCGDPDKERPGWDCLLSSSGNLQDFTQMVFDPINRVLYWPWFGSLAYSRPTLFIYHPDTATWETDPMYQPEGKTVRGNHFAFDPVNNVLLSYGGLCSGDQACGGPNNVGDHDPSLTDFFLYRYAPGGGIIVKKPVGPASLQTSASAIDIILNWPASVVDSTHDAATGYNIYRDKIKVGATNKDTLTYKDTVNLPAGTIVVHEVSAFNSGGESDTRALASTTIPTDTSIPTGLTSVCSADGTQVTVSWNAVVDASSYYLRINDPTNDNPNCLAGLICDDGADTYEDQIASLSFVRAVVPGRSYAWWVHSFVNGVLSPAVSSSFTCDVSPPPPPQNAAPVASAGPDQTITLPGVASLNGTATDDGLPTGSALTVQWSKVSGPGTVTFADASKAGTTAMFSAAGSYVLNLSASDSSLTASDDVLILVNPVPPEPVTNYIDIKTDTTINKITRCKTDNCNRTIQVRKSDKLTINGVAK